jgi:hypothetical protein
LFASGHPVVILDRPVDAFVVLKQNEVPALDLARANLEKAIVSLLRRQCSVFGTINMPISRKWPGTDL